jgi:streptogramin lyase
LLSDSTRALLADEEEVNGIAFRDLGALALKDFDRPIRVYRISVPGLPDVDTRPRARAGRRRGVLAAAGALVICVVALAAVLMTTLGGGRARVRVSLDDVAILDPGSGTVRSAVPVGAAPGSIAVDPGAAWVANRGSSTITRIDARTHATSTIGGFQSGLDQLAAGRGGLWATERAAGLATVDVSTLTASPPVPLVARTGVPYSAEAITYGFGALWIGGGLPSGLMLLRVDPAKDQVVARAPVGPRSLHSIAVGQGGVWVSNLLGNVVVEFEPKTLRVVRRIRIGGPTAIALGGGALWVCGGIDKGVWRLDAQGGYRSRHLVPVGGDPVAVAYGEGAAWAALRDGTIVRIDVRASAVRSTKIASTLNSVALGDGVVWAEVGPVTFL